MPPAAAGQDVAPSVALSYDSSSVDGQIASTNNQSTWVGEGWDYSPGYVERTYRSCSDYSNLDSASWTNSDGKTGDECWAGQIISLSFGAHSGALVLDDSTGTWHLANDDGSRVELIGAGNGGYQGEYWRITTTDGIQYYFGLQNLPGSGPGQNTNATWTEPVYAGHTGDPCYQATRFNSCTQAWRWNLDYVVDPHDNATAFYYTPETNYYGAENKTTPVQYTRGGYLNEIDYGLRHEAGTIYASPAPDRVIFKTATRTNASGGWPDTPTDQDCGSSGTCNNNSPTFWTRRELTEIDTSYYDGSAYKTVDAYALAQSFPTAGDAELHLDSITRTGYAADGTSLALPPVSFNYALLDNRVANYNSQGQMQHWRLNYIYTETGEVITVYYSGQPNVPFGTSVPLCTGATVPAHDYSDTTECFPVYWEPPDNPTPILDYFHKYVAIEVDLMDANSTAPTRITTYTYKGGAAWHFDDNEVVKPKNRTYGQFRGYAQVETRTGNPTNVSNGTADAWTLSRATYFRGMYGDSLPTGTRGHETDVSDTVGDAAYTDQNAFAGTALEVQTFNGDGGPEVGATVTDPQIVATTASRSRTGLPSLLAQMVRTQTSRAYTDLAAGGTRYTKLAYQYDSAGRVTGQTDTGTSVTTRCAWTSYADNTGSWIRDHVAETITAAQTCPADGSAPSPVLSDARTYYDNSTTLGQLSGPGDATLSKTATGTASAIKWAQSNAFYDASGRTTQTISYADSNDVSTRRVTTIEYTPTDGGPLTKVKTTDPAVAAGQFSSSVTLDPARGLPTRSVDIAGHPTDGAYDPLGRLTSLWQPGQVKGTDPASVTYSYQLGPSAPLALTSRTLVDPGNGTAAGYVTSIQIYDAFGQLRQTQSDAVGGGRVIIDSFTDSHGWTVRSNNRWFTTSSPGTSVITTADSGVDDRTITAYDGAGRPTVATEYKGTTSTWTTQTYYSGDSTTIIPPSGGVERTTHTDARGNPTELDQWLTPPTITNNVLSGGTARKATYHYTALDQRDQTTTAVGTPSAATWTWTYDLAGRVISQTNPDAGATSLQYLDTGEVAQTTDAKQQTLLYDYDTLGRKTAEYLGSKSSANLQATWVYDTLQPGQLTSSVRYSGTSTYKVEATGYDSAGNPNGTTISSPNFGTGFSSSYTTSYAWTTTHLLTAEVPASGGTGGGALPNETIRFYYDSRGDPTAQTGFNAYVSASTYSAYGEPTQYTLGVNAQIAWLNFAYDAQTRRPTETTLSAQTATPQIEDTKYQYDAYGNINRTDDTQGGGTGAPVERQCFTYDALAELIQAWSSTGTLCVNSDPTKLGNNSKVAGPQPYWYTWNIDPGAGRSKQVKHVVTGGGFSTDITTNYTNGVTTNPTHAHALASTATSGGSTGSTSYVYDADGNTTTRKLSSTTTQTLIYTPENRLSTDKVTVSGVTSGTISYVYDANGNQILRQDTKAGTTTLYLPGEELTRTDSTGAISGTRYYTHNGVTVAMRVGLGNPTYLYADLHGTNQTAVPTTATGTGTVIRRHYDPYGNPLGSNTGTWPTGDNHTFLNKPANSNTGLVDVGARQYDPTTGRFLAVDPLLNHADPQSLNGYGYADNSPITGSDPTGLMDLSQGGGGPCNLRCQQALKSIGGTSTNTSGGQGPGGDYTTRHNQAVEAAIAYIYSEEKANGNTGHFDFHLEIPDASKACLYGKVSEPNCGVGIPDIVWVDQHNNYWVWEVKSRGEGYKALREAEWYVEKMKDDGYHAILGWPIGAGLPVGNGDSLDSTEAGVILYGPDPHPRSSSSASATPSATPSASASATPGVRASVSASASATPSAAKPLPVPGPYLGTADDPSTGDIVPTCGDCGDALGTEFSIALDFLFPEGEDALIVGRGLRELAR